MAMSTGGRNRGALSEINVTPLVDVMLVLLIVFMITAPLLVRGEDVSLPKTRSGPIQTNPDDDPLAISIKANGDIFIQTTKVDVDSLGPQIQAIIGEGYDSPIYVRGDKDTPYGEVVEVMAEIKAAGYTRVSLVTEQKK